MEDKKLFQIGDVARMFHISTGSLRHYEQKIDHRLEHLRDVRNSELDVIQLKKAPPCAFAAVIRKQGRIMRK